MIAVLTTIPRPALTFRRYKAADGWRWRLVARNGRIVADSAEAYSTPRNCDRAIATITDGCDS